MRLSNIHGVAPALTICRICGKECQELALLGSECDTVMEKLYYDTNGACGNQNGYQEYGNNKVLATEPCDECKSILNNGGCIVIAQDTGEYLKLSKEQVGSLVGRVGKEINGEFMCIDFDRMRGKVCNMERAFWVQDEEGNIRLRDPKEW